MKIEHGVNGGIEKRFFAQIIYRNYGLLYKLIQNVKYHILT